MAGELSLLIKPVSADCNMRCQYCFYIRPGDPYRSHKHPIMNDITLRTMISGYMRSAGRCASFGWQGGEPLLASLDFFKRVVDYQQRYGLSGQLVSNNLQTNGLLLNDEWANFFKRYHFFIGVSLDGPEEDHNVYRHSLNGNNSFQQTMKGIQTLKDHQVEFGILTVVNDVTVKKPVELYQFFISNELYFLQFIPCVEIDRDTQKVKDYSVSVKDYRDFLCALFDVWYNKGQPLASIRLFENILAIHMGMNPEICAFQERCGSYVVVEYNGDVYPCDFFVEDRWKAGNLIETPIDEIIKNRGMQTFNHRKIEQSSGCQGCEWNFICHCGCQHYRLPDGKNYLCEAYKEFFNRTQKRFDLLKQNLLR
jgi:uncharacterized protein